MDTHEQIPDSHFDSIEEPTVEQEYREYNAREQYRREQNLKAAEDAAAEPTGADRWESPMHCLFDSGVQEYLAIMGGNLHIASPVRWDWIPANGKHRDTVQVIGAILNRLDYGPAADMPRAALSKEIAASCQLIAEDPIGNGIRVVEPWMINQVPSLPVKDGLLDLRYGAVRTGKEAMDLLRIRSRGGIVEYRPEILENPPERAQAFLKHFGKRLLRRMAYLMLKTDKVIDVVRIDAPDWGKTTLSWMMKNAFPEQVETGNAKSVMAGNSGRFSTLSRWQAEKNLVILDEGDKADPKHLGPENINRLADRFVDVEKKGVDAENLPRLGNAMFIGNDWPPLVLGVGSAARFKWAYHKKGEPLSAELIEWCQEDEAVVWFRAYMVREMAEIWGGTHELGREYWDPEGEETARQMLDQLEDPLVTLLKRLFVADPQGWESSADIRGALMQELARIQLEIKVPANRGFGALVRMAFPKAGEGRSPAARGYSGISRRM